MNSAVMSTNLNVCASKANVTLRTKRVTASTKRVAPMNIGWRHAHTSCGFSARSQIRSQTSQSRSRVVKVMADNEKSRIYRRVVFGGPEWVRHRSSGRYGRHISSMFSSRIIRNLLGPVSFFTSIAILVSFVNTYGEDPTKVMLPMSPFSLTAGALSLLLVFRTNSSYGRWWEARKIWGGLLNRSRDFVRQGVTWFKPEDQALKEQLVRYTIAFAYSLKAHLRPGFEDMREEIEGVLLPNEVEEALQEVHVPNHLLRIISAIVWEAKLDPILTTQMDENITFFEDVLGKCERIFKTPIPVSYTRMTSRFLIVWLTFLPLALYKDLGIVSIPVEFFTALFLLGIEDIGVQIEEPFSILSCEAICGSVENNSISLLVTQDKSNAIIDSPGQPELVSANEGAGFFEK